MNNLMYRNPVSYTEDEAIYVGEVVKMYLENDFNFDQTSPNKRTLKLTNGQEIQYDHMISDVVLVGRNEANMKVKFTPLQWSYNRYNKIDVVRKLTQTSVENALLSTINTGLY